MNCAHVNELGDKMTPCVASVWHVYAAQHDRSLQRIHPPFTGHRWIDNVWSGDVLLSFSLIP